MADSTTVDAPTSVHTLSSGEASTLEAPQTAEAPHAAEASSDDDRASNNEHASDENQNEAAAEAARDPAPIPARSITTSRVRPRVSVDMYWQEMLSPSSEFSQSYLTDSLATWSKNLCELVFVSSKNGPGFVLDDEDKHSILQQIAQRFRDLGSLEQPQVSFNGEQVRISSLSHKLLASLWHRPPVVHDELMLRVSRGLPWADASVYIAEGLQSISEFQLQHELEDEYEAFSCFKPLMVVARLYAVDDSYAEPMFAGQIMAIGRDTSVFGETPKCLGRPMKRQDIFGDTEKSMETLIWSLRQRYSA